MLFQPTNITPDVLGGALNGTINASSGLTISWQINGNSPLVAYRIAICTNDTASTTLYSTGIVTLSTPIQPVDYKGNAQRCSATISAADLSSAGITNGHEYKFAIRQFWDANNLDDAHSVRTRSDRVFLTRAMAHVKVVTPTPNTTLSGYQQTFTAQYYQGASYDETRSYDPIDWVRWRIYDSADRGRTIYDSQKIYTQELKLDYDGFLNGRTYIIQVDIQNSVGQTSTDSVQYEFSWSTQVTKDVATACKVNNQSSAVKVSWDAVEYIPGTGSGNYAVKNGILRLNSTDSSVVWNKQNDAPFAFENPWALIMQTTLIPDFANHSNEILWITMDNGSTDMSTYITYNSSSSGIATYARNMNYGARLFFDPLDPEVRLRIYVDNTKMIIYRLSKGEGLTPSTTLTPSETLVPEWEENLQMKQVLSRTYQSLDLNLTKIKVGGIQAVDYIEVVESVTEEQKEEMQAWASSIDDDAMTQITAYPNNVFYTDFNNGLDAGSFSIGGVAITGWDVYRKHKSEAFSRHLGALPLGQTSFLDYGCASQQGKYTYFVYPRSAAGIHITNAIQSNTIKPVFWNWSIIEATYDKNTDVYTVVSEYIFRNNVSTGSVSNNNAPSISPNFTRYPTVQMSHTNYQSGTLSGLIGQVGYTSYVVKYGNSLVDLEERFKTSQADILADNDLATWENHGYAGKVIKLFNPNGLTDYFDDKTQRDLIWALSTSTNHLFLKSRKGDLIEIKISGEITMDTADNTAKQAITASIPWVEIGDATNRNILGGY